MDYPAARAKKKRRSRSRKSKSPRNSRSPKRSRSRSRSPPMRSPNAGAGTYDISHREHGRLPPPKGEEYRDERPKMPTMSNWDILHNTEQFTIVQKYELAEMYFGCETQNKYEILNERGDLIFYAKEESDCCARNILLARRGFIMHIFNIGDGSPFLILDRPCKCTILCCNLQRIHVLDPNNDNSPLGTIIQQFSCYGPRLTCRDENGDVIYKIAGGCVICTSCCCPTYKMEVTDGSGQEIGNISKHWRGFCSENFSDADLFSITFPRDAHVRHKALLMAALFLIDYLYFENNNSSSRRNGGSIGGGFSGFGDFA